jgi:hypothetical protein
MIEAAYQYIAYLNERRVPVPFTYNYETILKIMVKYEHLSKHEVMQGDLCALKKTRSELHTVAKHFKSICSWCRLTEGGSWDLIEKKHLKDTEFRAFCENVFEAYSLYSKDIFKCQKKLKSPIEVIE